jgi:hypothetical protein
MDTLPGVKENKFLSPEPEKKLYEFHTFCRNIPLRFPLSLTYFIRSPYLCDRTSPTPTAHARLQDIMQAFDIKGCQRQHRTSMLRSRYCE